MPSKMRILLFRMSTRFTIGSCWRPLMSLPHEGNLMHWRRLGVGSWSMVLVRDKDKTSTPNICRQMPSTKIFIHTIFSKLPILAVIVGSLSSLSSHPDRHFDPHNHFDLSDFVFCAHLRWRWSW